MPPGMVTSQQAGRSAAWSRPGTRRTARHRWTPDSSPSWSISSTYSVPFFPNVEVHDVGESGRVHGHRSGARIHAVHVRAADREREAGELADEYSALSGPLTTQWAPPASGCRLAERVGDQAVGEHRQVRDAAPLRFTTSIAVVAGVGRSGEAAPGERTSTGLESIAGLPIVSSGFSSRSNAQMSAILRIFPFFLPISSSRPNRSETGSCRGVGLAQIGLAPRRARLRRPAIGDKDVIRTECRDAVRADGVVVARRVRVRGQAFDEPRLAAPPSIFVTRAPWRPCKRTLTTDEARPAATAAGLRLRTGPHATRTPGAGAVEPGRHGPPHGSLQPQRRDPKQREKQHDGKDTERSHRPPPPSG